MDPESAYRAHPRLEGQGRTARYPGVRDRVLFLSATGGRAVPTGLLPDCFLNHGNYIVRLGDVVKWLGKQAGPQGRGSPGFAGAEVLFDDNGAVRAWLPATWASPARGEQGPRLRAGHGTAREAYTLFAEGCRGHLGKQLESRFKLREDADPQTYGLGIKELWEVPAANHKPGLVVPPPAGRWTTRRTGRIRLSPRRQAGVGRLCGRPQLQQPHLSPFEEFQRYKTHPEIRKFLEGGKRLAYGARAIAAGGLQSLPKLTFPGGGLIGDDAGFLNAARIKGSHAAIKSGMLAAEAAIEAHSPPSASATSSAPIRRPSNKAGCTTSSTKPATSSPGS